MPILSAVSYASLAPAMAPTSGRKHIVVLGGSYGGVSVAHNILKHTFPHLPKPDDYQLVMISTSAQAMNRPGTPRALIADAMFDQARFFVSVPAQFGQYPKGSYRFIRGAAVELDHDARTVSYRTTRGRVEQLPYYALVIATGASTPSPLFSFNRDEETLRNSWAAVRQALPSVRSIVVAGGGPTGVEVAGELGEYLNGHAGAFSGALAKPRVPITLVTSDARILPLLRPGLAAKAEAMLAKVGVTVLKGARVRSVTPEGAGADAAAVAAPATVTLEGGRTLAADLYIPAGGLRYNTAFVAPALRTSAGRVAVNPATLRVDAAGPRVYALGDAAAAARPAVHLVLAQAPVLAANLKRDVLRDAGCAAAAPPEDRLFREDTRETQMVPIGKGRGVGAGAGYALPSVMVWLLKGRDYWLWTTANLWSGKQWAKEA